MEVNEHLILDLRRFADGRGVTLCDAPGHVTMKIVRSGISLSILIPRGILEWWVEASDATSGAKVEDWCDYTGYDADSIPTLSENMRADVLSFVENAVGRPLRMNPEQRALQWNVAGDWIQAVPLAPHVIRDTPQ